MSESSTIAFFIEVYPSKEEMERGTDEIDISSCDSIVSIEKKFGEERRSVFFQANILCRNEKGQYQALQF
jgi:hypothetical protein